MQPYTLSGHYPKRLIRISQTILPSSSSVLTHPASLSLLLYPSLLLHLRLRLRARPSRPHPALQSHPMNSETRYHLQNTFTEISACSGNDFVSFSNSSVIRAPAFKAAGERGRGTIGMHGKTLLLWPAGRRVQGKNGTGQRDGRGRQSICINIVAKRGMIF